MIKLNYLSPIVDDVLSFYCEAIWRVYSDLVASKSDSRSAEEDSKRPRRKSI